MAVQFEREHQHVPGFVFPAEDFIIALRLVLGQVIFHGDMSAVWTQCESLEAKLLERRRRVDTQPVMACMRAKALHEKEMSYAGRVESLSTQLATTEHERARLQAGVALLSDQLQSQLESLQQKDDALRVERLESEKKVQALRQQLLQEEERFRAQEAQLTQDRQDAYEALQDALENVKNRRVAEQVEILLDCRIAQVTQKEKELAQRSEELATQQEDIKRSLAEHAAVRHKLEKEHTSLLTKLSVPASWTTGGDSGLQLVSLSRSDGDLWIALSKLLKTERNDLGSGRDYFDYLGRPYKSLELAFAWRLEHRSMWYKYAAEINKICNDLAMHGTVAPKVPKRGAVMEEADALPDPLNSVAQETYLLHGTRPEHILGILESGFNERFQGRGYFGFGCYLADDAGKADQYVSRDHGPCRAPTGLSELHELLYPHGTRKLGKAVFYMLVCRVALGYAARSFDGEVIKDDTHRVFCSAKNPGAKEQKRELATVPGSRGLHYHSLVIEVTPEEDLANAAARSRRVTRYREYILTHGERIYPQYLLAVRRV
eukprot:TRINITY_DN72575_c0_g1_i2.p2 TRINITY_DN72575_c0_g1~~TRINITY_DN72575_c0_g1_i2.p2  ORF type:complete len:546 (+),score=46.55 TRINITY_DN72575_c0_g1_i2:2015-3652(+)